MDKLINQINKADFNFITYLSPATNKIINKLKLYNYKTGQNEIATLTTNQKNYLNHLENNRLTINSKPRQVGESTLTIIHLLASFLTKNKNIIIITPNLTSSYEIIKKMRLMMYGTDLNIVKSNKGQIDFNGFVIKTTTNIDGLRGRKWDIIYISEADYICDIISMYNRIILYINKPQIIITATSTENGIFQNLYAESMNGNSNFKPFKFNITDNPKFNKDII